MKVIVYTKNIIENIEKAQTLVNIPISLMFKDFYEDIYEHIADRVTNNIFGLHLKNSICYSISKAVKENKGAVVTSFSDAWRCLNINGDTGHGIREFYIPINACDNREGLSIYEVRKLSDEIRMLSNSHICGLITSGCLNENHPSEKELYSIWSKLRNNIESISLGGSFWLGQDSKLPGFISDVRIGEYMLFGTIPYCNDKQKKGLNGIELQTKVIGVFPERGQLILDCGYSMADLDKCHIDYHKDLKYVDSSSEYTIMECEHVSDYCIGDVVTFVPNYKSLVKLRYAEYEYR
jgi:predicted amino acid racemase